MSDLLKGFEEVIDEAELEGHRVIVPAHEARQLLVLARAGVRPAPCYHACEANAFQIEIRQLKTKADTADLLQIRVGELAAEVERLQSVIDAANAQESVGTSCDEVADYGLHQVNFTKRVELGQKLYASPIPAQQSPAVAVPEPSELDVYRWFQESTIAHHIEEDGGHISKRAMFLAKKAIAFAQPSPRITEQDDKTISSNASEWSQRVTEQELRKWVCSAIGLLDEYVPNPKPLTDIGRALLNKLNEVKNG